MTNEVAKKYQMILHFSYWQNCWYRADKDGVKYVRENNTTPLKDKLLIAIKFLKYALSLIQQFSDIYVYIYIYYACI